MDTNSFAFALALFFVYWIGEGLGLLFEQAFVDLQRKCLFNKFLKSILKGVD